MTRNPDCPLCGSHVTKKRFSIRGFDLLVCDHCELLFIHPFPTNIEKRHVEVEESNFQRLEIPDAAKHYQGEVQFYKKYFPLVAAECRHAHAVLDAGCGTGHLLQLLGQFPKLFRVGIELNPARAQLARKYSGCEIHQTPIENFSGERKFDVITMINVLSHIPSFDRLFASVRSLLCKGGKLILRVGEFPKDVNRGAIFDWGIPDHVHFLGHNTIYHLCDKYRFDVSKHERVRLSSKIFTREGFKIAGRSRLRNSVKHIIAYTPFAIPALRKLYDVTYGKGLYSSFIVITVRP